MITNTLLIELRAHASRMTILADNSTDPVTTNLAKQAVDIVNQLISRDEKIFESESTKGTTK